MDELEVIFDPKKKIDDKVDINDVENLKKSLNKIQINISIFTTIIDSIERKGEICKLKNKENSSEEQILDFKRV